jgi:cytochrome P450
MIQKRREAIYKDPKDGDKGDLLSIMLKDPLFENNDEKIVNESLTFFLAGTLTQANIISNVISYLIKDSDI